MINPEVALWCDVHEMQNLIQQARLLSTRDARTEDLWRKAVALYRGEFLTSVTSDWAGYIRERLQETFIEALIGAANSLRVRGSSQEALRLLKRALNIDPYREDVYRVVMQCYSDLGERQQVLSYFRRLQQVLHQELAIKPSQETVILVEQLLH
jgi:DNA-binding SARP family transcriptional activator